jgi:hypothetical protein
MFDEPDEDEPKSKNLQPPQARAAEKAEEFRMHAELCAAFEGPRKHQSELRPDLAPELARDIQQSIGKLEKLRLAPSNIVLPDDAYPEATRLLTLSETKSLATGDYHLHRRPGEVHIVRFLTPDDADTFYTRLQAHFDAALEGFKEEERQAHEWRGDARQAAFIKALDDVDANLAERYHRPVLHHHKLFLLSTQTADEINIAYLADTIMGVSPETLVGKASAPPEDGEGGGPTDADLAWFFKLFLLRGIVGTTERMLLYTFLQKTDDSFDF